MSDTTVSIKIKQTLMIDEATLKPVIEELLLTSDIDENLSSTLATKITERVFSHVAMELEL